MKITIIAGHYLYTLDGIGRYTNQLIKELRKLDNKIYIDIIPERMLSTKKNRIKNIITNILPTTDPSIIKITNQILMELNYFFKFKKDRFEYPRKLKNIKSQVYHAMSPSEAVAAVILKKRPLITTFHDIIPLVSDNRFFLEKYYFNYYVNMAKKSNIIIADSNNTKTDLINKLGISKNKIRVIYPGVDTSKFYPKKIFKSDTKKILYLGGLIKRKGIYELLFAFNKLIQIRKDIKLLIAGCGEEELKLRQEVAKNSINDYVEFLGFVDENKIVETYHKADLFVYLSKYEGFGYTPLEAMACGIPVLASNMSSIPEVVGKAGILVNPYDTFAIYNNINIILNNSRLQNEMRNKGLKQINKFSIEISAKKILKLYKTLL